MPSAREKKTKNSSLQSAENRMMIEKISGLLYLCNPLANEICRKDSCFWYAWKNTHDGNSWFPCYKTCFEEYAARDAEGKPIVWPDGVVSLETVKELKQYYEQKNKRNHEADASAEAAGREQFEKP